MSPEFERLNGLAQDAMQAWLEGLDSTLTLVVVKLKIFKKEMDAATLSDAERKKLLEGIANSLEVTNNPIENAIGDFDINLSTEETEKQE